MSKISVALRLADEAGVTVEKALKYVDEVGLATARSYADDLAAKGSRTVSNWWKPAAVGGTAVGGGALVWRQQDVEKAQAIAAQEKSLSESLAEIMNSDLPPSVKRELSEKLFAAWPTDDNAGFNLPDLGNVFGDVQTTVVALLVLALVLRYSLGGD